jgi:preprotein translocase subunit SecG
VDLASPLSPALGALIHVLHGTVLVLFVVTALLLTLVILVQEGKGGGLAGAFGGAGAEAFGVKAGSVHRFTAWLAAAFLGLALIHAGMTTHIAEADKKPGGGPSIEEFRGTGTEGTGSEGTGTTGTDADKAPGGGTGGDGTDGAGKGTDGSGGNGAGSGGEREGGGAEEPAKDPPPEEDPPPEKAPDGTDSPGGGGQ